MKRPYTISSMWRLLERIGVLCMCFLSFDLSNRRWVGWLGLVLLLANVVTSLFVVLWNALGYEDIEELPLAITAGFGIVVVWSIIPIFMVAILFGVAVSTITLTSVRKFHSVKQKLTHSMYEKVNIVEAIYASMTKQQQYIHIVLLLAVALLTILWIVPNLFSIRILGFTSIAPPIILQVYSIVWSVLGGFAHLIIASGSSMILFYPLLISSFALVLNPTNAQLLKRILYIFVCLIATFVPSTIFVTMLDNVIFDDSMRNTPYLLFAFLPTYLLLAVVLPYLFSQRARLSALGGRVKRNIRFLAVGGVAMQLFFMVYWAVLTAPEAGVFYIASVVFAVFLALAWAMVLLLVGERTKRDWGLFALIVAVQVASVVVTAPGVVSA